jgi:antitoxin component of MazEF toxin-antitoxin module
VKTRVQRWGNSLAVRIVKGGLLLEPSTELSPSLEELLGGVTESNLHDEVDTGPAQGVEFACSLPAPSIAAVLQRLGRLVSP